MRLLNPFFQTIQIPDQYDLEDNKDELLTPKIKHRHVHQRSSIESKR